MRRALLGALAALCLACVQPGRAGFSPAPVPQGNTVAYTPSVSAQTPGATPPTFTVNSAGSLAITPKIVFVRADVSVTAAGTGTGFVFVSLPAGVTPVGNQSISGLDNNSGTGLRVSVNASGMTVTKVDASTFIGTGARMIVSGFIEVQ